MQAKKIGIYIAPFYNYKELIRKKNNLNGVEKKIVSQIKTFKEDYNFDITFFNSFNDIREEELLRSDFIYMRKTNLADKTTLLFLRRAKKVNSRIKVLLEIPTYPYDSELDVGILLHIKDAFFRNLYRYYIDCIVTYSGDKKIFGITTINVVNAIDFESNCRTKFLEKKPENIPMIAVANLDFWHGYDRAIKGLYNFYQHYKQPDFVLYIVGEGSEYIKYKEMVKKYQLQKHVILTGFKSGDDLVNLYDKCVIGLDSMGRHRSGVYYNSSLKGKEYCAKGLMIVSGVKTELDKVKNFPYYLRVPADDSSIDFKKVFDFYEKNTLNKSIFEVQKNIVGYAESNYNYKIAMIPIKNYINS